MDGSIEEIWQTVQELWATPQADILRGVALMARALIVVVIAVIIARWVDRWLSRRLHERRLDPTVATMYRKLVGAGIAVVAMSWILAVFGASWSALVTLIGASTVVVAFSVQDLLRNYVAGFYMLVEQPIRVGDDIRVKGVEGVVSAMAIRTTHLVTTDGELVIVPNSVLFLEMVTNYSRAEANVTVVTIAKLSEAIPVIVPAVTEALSPLSGVMSQPPEVRLMSITSDGAEARVSVHRDPGDDYLTAILTLLHARFPDAELRDATITS